MEISPPLSNLGVLVTKFKIPPGATFPYNKAEPPFKNSTLSKEETSGIDPELYLNPFLNILLAPMS